jgi:transposase
MLLHGNAALSVKKRLVLCRRVVEQNWTLTRAAEAAEVSVRTARKWVRRYRVDGEAGLLDRPSTPAAAADAHRGGPGAGDRGAAAVADDRG